MFFCANQFINLKFIYIKRISYDILDTEEFWESEGLQMKMVEPMKKWKVTYNGEMVHQATGQRYDVNLEVLQLFLHHISRNPHIGLARRSFHYIICYFDISG